MQITKAESEENLCWSQKTEEGAQKTSDTLKCHPEGPRGGGPRGFVGASKRVEIIPYMSKISYWALSSGKVIGKGLLHPG